MGESDERDREQQEREPVFPRVPALVRLRHRAEVRLRGRAVPVTFAAAYRPPLAGVEAQVGFDPRCAEMVQRDLRVARWLDDRPSV